MIRIALIGCESTTEEYIALNSRLSRISFTAVVENPSESVAEFAEATGIKIVAANVDELLQKFSTEFDALLVNTNSCSSIAIYKQAVESGKHLLINYPLIVNEPEILGQLQMATKGQGRVMLGQLKRYIPAVVAIKQSLNSGNLGEPGLLRIHCWHHASASEKLSLRIMPEIDLACWMFGDIPSQIFAVGKNVCTSEVSTFQYLQVHLGFADGGMALIDLASSSNAGPGYDSISLIGSTGAAYADDHHNMQIVFQGKSSFARRTDARIGNRIAELREFEEAISHQHHGYPSGADALLALRIMESIFSSVETGQAVHREGEEYVSR